MDPRPPLPLVEEEAYRKKMDALEKKHGASQELKIAIEQTLAAAHYDPQAKARTQLRGFQEDVRLVPFNQLKLNGWPEIFILLEVGVDRVTLIDLEYRY